MDGKVFTFLVPVRTQLVNMYFSSSEVLSSITLHKFWENLSSYIATFPKSFRERERERESCSSEQNMEDYLFIRSF